MRFAVVEITGKGVSKVEDFASVKEAREALIGMVESGAVIPKIYHPEFVSYGDVIYKILMVG